MQISKYNKSLENQNKHIFFFKVDGHANLYAPVTENVYLILISAGSITQITYENIFCDRCIKVGMSINFEDKNVFILIFQTSVIFGNLHFILELREYLKQLSQLRRQST